MNKVSLRVGDALLVQGHKKEIERLRRDENFVVLEEVSQPAARRQKVPLALGALVGAVALAALNILPIEVSALLGALAMVVTRCLTLEEAYASVDWKVIFLLAGILPLGLTLERTGGAELLAHHAIEYAGGFGHRCRFRWRRVMC